MAEFRTPEEIRRYPLSNGGTADLIDLIGTGVPADWMSIESPADVAIGTVAYVAALGGKRRGVVVKTTPSKVHVALTTQGAVDTAQQSGWPNQPIRVQIVATPFAWIAPRG